MTATNPTDPVGAYPRQHHGVLVQLTEDEASWLSSAARRASTDHIATGLKTGPYLVALADKIDAAIYDRPSEGGDDAR